MGRSRELQEEAAMEPQRRNDGGQSPGLLVSREGTGFERCLGLGDYNRS